MFLESVAPLTSESKVVGMIGAKALPKDFLGACPKHMPELFVQLVRRERNDVVWLPYSNLAAILVQAELACLAVLLEQVFEHLFTYLIKLLPLDGGMAEIEAVGELVLQPRLVSSGKQVGK